MSTSLDPRLLLVWILTALNAGSAPIEANCEGRTTAYPVPECLWLSDFRPADTPGKPLPPERDSSKYNSTLEPSCSTGLELFKDIDILGDYAYVSYNAGLQVWRIDGSNEAKPQRVVFADGFSKCPGGGTFLAFIHFGELDTAVDNLEVVQGPHTAVLIALSGYNNVGPSIWRFDTSTEELKELYQDSSRNARSVAIQDVGGTIYAFSASETGVDVYDASKALESFSSSAGCLDTTGTGCGGVRTGTIGTNGSWVDTVVSEDGRLHVIVAGGALSATLDIWEVSDPSLPDKSSSRRYAGTGAYYQSPVVFTKDGRAYLGVVERTTTNNLEILDIDDCLAQKDGTCASLGPEKYVRALLNISSRQKLTFSISATGAGVTPFLYYGIPSVTMSGAGEEALLDLSTLGTTEQSITEVTGGGPTYQDGCSGEAVGYWGWYYPRNDCGTNEFSPLAGMFNGAYFYKINNSTFDIHIRGDAGGPPQGAPQGATCPANCNPGTASSTP